MSNKKDEKKNGEIKRREIKGEWERMKKIMCIMCLNLTERVTDLNRFMNSLSIALSPLTICHVGDSIIGHGNTYKQDKHGTTSSGIFITIQNKVLKVTKVIITKII